MREIRVTDIACIHRLSRECFSRNGLHSLHQPLRNVRRNGCARMMIGLTRVPLVVQSCLFDLTVGDKNIRPDHAMGYDAAKTALESPNY